MIIYVYINATKWIQMEKKQTQSLNLRHGHLSRLDMSLWGILIHPIGQNRHWVAMATAAGISMVSTPPRAASQTGPEHLGSKNISKNPEPIDSFKAMFSYGFEPSESNWAITHPGVSRVFSFSYTWYIRDCVLSCYRTAYKEHNIIIWEMAATGKDTVVILFAPLEEKCSNHQPRRYMSTSFSLYFATTKWLGLFSLIIYAFPL